MADDATDQYSVSGHKVRTRDPSVHLLEWSSVVLMGCFGAAIAIYAVHGAQPLHAFVFSLILFAILCASVSWVEVQRRHGRYRRATVVAFVGSLVMLLAAAPASSFDQPSPLPVYVLPGSGPVQGRPPVPLASENATYPCPPSLSSTSTRTGTFSVILDVKSGGCWDTRTISAPAGVLPYLLAYTNTSTTTQSHVVLRVNLVPGTVLVPNSTYLYDGTHPKGKLLPTDDLVGGGFDVGEFAVGAVAYIKFRVALPISAALHCGVTTFTLTGTARPSGWQELSGNAAVYVQRLCGG